jgi:hypothetical protein
MKYTRILNALLFAVVLLLPISVIHSQGNVAPMWLSDNWRRTQYPASEWYIGFAVDDVPKTGAKIAEIRQSVERAAQAQLAEGITVNIKREVMTDLISEKDGNEEKIRRNFHEMIAASVDTEIGKVETEIYHDQANNKVYAIAMVKKTELASYYVTRIEFYLQLARNDFNLAKQHHESDRKRSALEKRAETDKNILECKKYNALLSVVDFKGDVKRLLDRVGALQLEHAALETKVLEAAPVFITGREIIDNSSAGIVIQRLQNKFSQNGCRVTDDKSNAGYILTVNVTNCMVSKDANFTYCYACVESDLINTKTGKSEARINFTGPKAAWTSAQEGRACRKAFEDAVDAMWKEITSKTEVCRQ